MNELVIPSLYLLAGVVAYASIYHFAYALSPPRDRVQMLFSAMCLFAVPFALFHAQNLQAANSIEFILSIKLEFLFLVPIYVLMAWFTALNTGKYPKPFLAGITLVGLVVSLANLYQPYSLQYDRFDGIHTLQLPWGETVSRGIGQPGPMMYVATVTFLLVVGFVIYALASAYRRGHRRTDLWMLLACGLFLLSGIEGVLARLSVINFIELGPFGFLVVVIVMSVSLTRETQYRLRNSERHFRMLFENLPIGMVAIDPKDGRILQANQSALKLIGYSAEEFLTMNVADLTLPDEQKDAQQRYEQLSKGLADHLYYEKHYIKKDGSSFLGYSSISTLKDDKGNVMRLIGSTIDITERKQTEDALRESEEKLQAVMNASEVAVAWATEDGKIEYVNPKFASIFGYSLDDVPTVEQWYLHAYPDPTYRAKVLDEWNAKVALSISGRTAIETMEVDINCKDGSVRHVLLMGSWAGNRLLVNFSDITERKRIEDALRESEARFRTIIKQSPIGISFARNGVTIDMNLVCLKMFGYDDIAEMCGQPLLNHIAPQSRPVVEYRMQRRLQGFPDETPLEAYGLRKDGSQFPLFISAKGMVFSDGPLTCGFLIDISDRKKADADLRIAATAFESQESLVITDAEGVILRVNKAFTESTGYTTEEVVGMTPRLLKSGRHTPEFYRTMWETLLHTGAWQGEIWDRRKNGEIYPKWLSISAVKGDDGTVTHYVGSHIDITERKASEEKIQHLAFYDHLTDLPNRLLLLDRLKQALVSSTRIGLAGALLFIDLDNFKNLNDTLGHDIGDILLKQVTQRLESCIREGDTVARLGGDEFVVMLVDLSEQLIEAAAQTEAIGEKILTALSQSYQLDKNTFRCTASIGVTLFSGNQQAADELMKQADIAMYQAKKAGRNTLRFFDRQMQENISARVSLEGELQKALEFQQFHLYYQIQVDSSHRPLGAEALIRWIHPARGMISPAQFIPLAEENGLILPIGQWVLETACAQLKIWQENALTRNLTLAVNVSARQFRQADFVAQVQAAVQRHSINAKLLKLELTESLLQDSIEETIGIMVLLHVIGVQFSLDDFGTGFSSLQYLKRLPLDQLKIDQSFVRDIATDGSDKAIVRTIISMARSLELDVIAEGVETEEQRQFLLNKGCTLFQGYLFGRPVPIEQFDAMIKKIN